MSILEFKGDKIAYDKFANSILSKIATVFEKQPLEGDLNEKEGVLSYKIKNLGEYILNKQPPLKQIWSSSPISGPKRFFIGNDFSFYCTKTNQNILDYIEDEMNKIKSKI